MYQQQRFWLSENGARKDIQVNVSYQEGIWLVGRWCKDDSALQRQNAENLKQIFPEKEYRGLSPNFNIHVSVSELYISTMGQPFLLEDICDRSWEYINRSPTHECGNWGWGRAIPRKGIYKRNCRCSVTDWLAEATCRRPDRFNRSVRNASDWSADKVRDWLGWKSWGHNVSPVVYRASLPLENWSGAERKRLR